LRKERDRGGFSPTILNESLFYSGRKFVSPYFMADLYTKHIPPQKIHFFQEKILEWYSNEGRTFHWRKKGLTHYQYVIAEVLLQRTKAETVAKFYPNFLNDFPNWKSLANAEIQKLEDYLKPVGLYRQRSKRLMSLAQEMVKRNSKLPRNREELESIPFMGQYIANAVELVIFNEPSPLVDVNMSRVLERFFGARKMADIRYDPYLQELSKKIVTHVDTKEINWAILDFAAIICKSREPLCLFCPIFNKCKAFPQFILKGKLPLL
jgi:A/G-specific adenine glycosylase